MQTIEKDVICVPAGADSMTKIQMDFDNQNLTRDADEPFEEVIRLPKRLQSLVSQRHVRLTGKGTQSTPVLKAEEDHDFLARHKEIIDSDAEKGGEKRGLDLLSSLKSIGEASAKASSPASPEVKEKVIGAYGSVPSPSASPVSAAAASASPDREHQVLADFFNSLIHKDRSAPRKSSAEFAKGLAIPPRQPSPANNVPREDVAKHLDRLRTRNKLTKD